jgi:hypothetical protein
MLYVFDFDWSLVEENSDMWVLDQLGASEVFRRLKGTGCSDCSTGMYYVYNNGVKLMWLKLFPAGLPWTQLMDASLLAAHAELGRSAQDVLAACRSTPLAPCMRQVGGHMAGLRVLTLSTAADS